MISASIVTYRTDWDELTRCVDSLMRNGVDRVFVCDNSPERELEDFCKRYDKLEYIFNKRNLGYGRGHNVALRRAQEMGTKYHLVINSDVYFDETDVIGRITTFMDKNTDVAQLIPNTVYPDGRLQYVVRLLPRPIDLIARRFCPKAWVKRLNRRYCLEFADHKRMMDVPYHQGSFMFFRVECFEKVGLFDERFFMYPEDIDMTRRMHRCYRTVFWPEVTIVHLHRASSYKSVRMLGVHMMNMVRYFNKWGWFDDKERKEWNRKLLDELGYNKLERKG